MKSEEEDLYICEIKSKLYNINSIWYSNANNNSFI